MIRRLIRHRWNLLRLALAAFLLWVLAADTAARLARRTLASLPDFDYAAEVRSLRLEGRYGEAMSIADAGLSTFENARNHALHAEIERERDLTRSEQESMLRRIRDGGLGALSGRGTNLESLLGAVAADFFIVGDIRDLVIEGGKQVLDGDSDEVVLLLSIVGIVTTLAPEVDWVPSVLKAAKRAGTLTKGMSEFLSRSIKARRFDELGDAFKDVRVLAECASPGGAIRLLAHADNPADLRKIASFVSRHPSGSFALHVTGDRGAALVKQGGDHAERLVLAAAKKGRAGSNFLSTRAARVMLRPHPLLGIAKSLWKGNAERLISRTLDRFDAGAWWAIPLLAAWVFLELSILLVRPAARKHAPHADHATDPALPHSMRPNRPITR